MNMNDLIKPPKVLGFRPERLQRAQELLESGLQENLYSAAVYGILRHGMIAAHGALGVAQPDADPPVPATFETLFDMASITKTMTATMLLQCIEEGRLQLSSTVGHLLPEAANRPLGKITVRQLATHASGLPAWLPLYKSKEPVLEQILAAELKAEPGKQYAYSDLGYITLGKILERLTETPLERLLQERICGPLGMKQSGYKPAISLRPQTAATAHYMDGKKQTLLGEVHDENAGGMDGIAGHAGLFSSAPDMIRFALALQFPTVAAHCHLPPVLGLLARRLAQHSQVDPAVGSHSIGWFTSPNGYLPQGDLLSSQSFGHTGFTGTLLLFDPMNDLAILLLTNRVISPSDGSRFLTLRRLFANIVGGAIAE